MLSRKDFKMFTGKKQSETGQNCSYKGKKSILEYKIIAWFNLLAKYAVHKYFTLYIGQGWPVTGQNLVKIWSRLKKTAFFEYVIIASLSLFRFINLMPA